MLLLPIWISVFSNYFQIWHMYLDIQYRSCRLSRPEMGWWWEGLYSVHTLSGWPGRRIRLANCFTFVKLKERVRYDRIGMLMI